MKMTLKKKLAENKKTIGAWLTVGHVQVVEAMLAGGTFDWLAVDFEHSEIGFADLPAIFNVCEKYSVAPLVRLSGNNAIEGRKALDLGAEGLIIPYAESAVKLSELCKSFFYPVKGERGLCLSRMNTWGESFSDYMRDFSPVIVPIIESKKGTANIAEIAALEFVDAIFIGPYDLSASLGKPGDFASEEFTSTLAAVKTAIFASRKAGGIHVVSPQRAELEKRLSEGFRFVAFGTDLIFIKDGAKAGAGLK